MVAGIETSYLVLNQLYITRSKKNTHTLQVRIFGENKENDLVRNEKMRQWAETRREEQGGNVHFVDFDHIAHSNNAPQGVGSLNWSASLLSILRFF